MKSVIILYVCAAVLAGAVIISCDGESYTPVEPPPPRRLLQDLTEKDHVLFNLEFLFNEFNDAEYEKLLDDNFVFFFSDADFSMGITPEQWARDIEITSYRNFYDPNRTEYRVTGRSLRLTYPEDNWTDITPDDPVQYPGEKWYVTTVTYDMAITIDTVPELTFIANGLQLEVTIRWDPEKGHYRMIRWRDDIGGLRSLLSKSAAVEETTWGGVKALYQ